MIYRLFREWWKLKEKFNKGSEKYIGNFRIEVEVLNNELKENFRIKNL